MKEYIERNALIAELEYDLANDVNIYHSSTGKEIRDNKIYFACDVLTSAPVADVKEVIHAKWENIEPYTAINGQYLKAQVCSNCDALFVSGGNEPYNNYPYCCVCGAKMDL